MKNGEIVKRVRKNLDDLVEPYLWDDEELFNSLSDCLEELCTDIPLLIDDSNTTAPNNVCNIAFTQVGGAKYALDSRVVKVISSVMDYSTFTNQPIDIVSRELLMSFEPYWKQYTAATPRFIVTNVNTGYIQLVPAPNISGTLKMTVWRLPLTRLNITHYDDSPEIPAMYHQYLIDGVLSKAYNKMDGETYNPKKQQEHEARWIRGMGKIKQSQSKIDFRNESVGAEDGWL